MSRETSPSTGRVYGLQKICEIFEISRTTYYRHQHLSAKKRRPGPKPSVPASVLLSVIRKDIESSPFKGEGHRKIHVRLRRDGHVIGRQRVLQIMRENNWLPPSGGSGIKLKPTMDESLLTYRMKCGAQMPLRYSQPKREPRLLPKLAIKGLLFG